MVSVKTMEDTAQSFIVVLFHNKILIMKKLILNLGKTLNKTEQKTINGGNAIFCDANGNCPIGSYCDGHLCIDNGSGNGESDPNKDCRNPHRFCIDEFDTCCIY